MKTALSIAGSDPSGGAGIQADIKTMTANGVYAMTAVTALTAQNTTGVYGVMEVPPEFVASQLDCIFTDIYPDAVKIGMLSSGAIMKTVAEKLKEYKAKHIVLDPVMVATSGGSLMQDEGVRVMQEELFPLAELITPNMPETEVLTGMKVKDAGDMETAAAMLWEKFHCAVLIKGGHRVNDANDFLYANGRGIWLEGKKIDTPNTHGTGCTLSSAIASNLALGYDLEQSVRRAKDYISGALGYGLDLGRDAGPMNHAYKIMAE